ncbi:unnamed protein product, partial [marine sediment metagenome]
LSFRLQQEKQKKMLDNIFNNFEDVLAKNEKLENEIQTQKEMYEQVNNNIKEIILTNKKMDITLAGLSEELITISSHQKNVNKQNIKYNPFLLPKNKEQLKGILVEKTNAFLKLTDTERNI